MPRLRRARREQAPAFSRHGTPEFCDDLDPPQTKEGAGKAGCRLHPWVPCKKSTGVGPQVNRKQPGFPCAVVYDLLRALLGDRLVATVIPEKLASHET